MFHGLIEFFSTNVFLNFFVPITGSRTLWMRKYNLIGSPFVFFSFLCLLFISYIQSLPLSFRYVGISLLATFPFYIKLVFFIILFPPPPGISFTLPIKILALRQLCIKFKITLQNFSFFSRSDLFVSALTWIILISFPCLIQIWPECNSPSEKKGEDF